MKKVKLLICLLLIGMMATLYSCKKKIEGCTSSIATDYDASATDDNGSCTYQGSIHFWYGQSTSTDLINAGISSLTFYVDGAVIGSYAANVYFNSDPNCGQSSVVSSTKSLGNVKTKTFSYYVLDDSSNQIWNGTVTYDASRSCTSYQLTY